MPHALSWFDDVIPTAEVGFAISLPSIACVTPHSARGNLMIRYLSGKPPANKIVVTTSERSHGGAMAMLAAAILFAPSAVITGASVAVGRAGQRRARLMMGDIDRPDVMPGDAILDIDSNRYEARHFATGAEP